MSVPDLFDTECSNCGGYHCDKFYCDVCIKDIINSLEKERVSYMACYEENYEVQSQGVALGMDHAIKLLRELIKK